jgi:hypothetical protein
MPRKTKSVLDELNDKTPAKVKKSPVRAKKTPAKVKKSPVRAKKTEPEQQNGNKDYTNIMFISFYLLAFSIAIGFLAWTSTFSTHGLTNEEVDAVENSIGLVFNYDVIRIFTIVALAVISAIALYSAYAIRNIKTYNIIDFSSILNISGILIVLISIAVLIFGIFSLVDDDRIKDYSTTTGTNEDIYKNNVEYRNLGITGTISGGLLIIMFISLLVWFYMRYGKLL